MGLLEDSGAFKACEGPEGVAVRTGPSTSWLEGTGDCCWAAAGPPLRAADRATDST